MTVAEAGRKGGKARLRKMTPEQRKQVAMLGGKATAQKFSSSERSQSARRAAEARWAKLKETVAKTNKELKALAKTATKKAREKPPSG